MPRPIPLLLTLSRETLSLTQQELADLVRSSLRTVQRWEGRRGSPSPDELHALADAVRPRDHALASELDAWAPRPAPPPAPVAPPSAQPAPLLPAPAAAMSPPSPPVPARVLVDSVVCAAAEAMTLAPQAIRPAVLAAFSRARDAGLTPEAVVAVLSAPEASSPAATATEAKRRAR
ncbi:MAG TPA: helix-turn-helix transcriptional regulator [Polyangiaceae bacterium]